MLNVTSTPVELIDDDTATTYYNDLDTLEGAERDSRAEALRLWADQKDADQKREQFDAVNKIYSDFDGYVNEAGLQDFDEDSRYNIANRQFIASQFDQTPEEQQDIYSSFRDKWTESVAGKTGLSEKETFGLIKQGIDARNEVSEAANQIPGDIALSLFDSIGGGDPVDVPKLIETWKTKNAESIKKLPPGWETPLLESAQAFHTETEGMLRDYAEPLKKVYDHLSVVTGRDTERAGETNPKNEEEMDSMVDTLASMPKPVRERAYASVVLGAKKAGQDPKTFMEQWGESWSRTLNMVRTGALTAQEMAAESEARQLENKETPPDYFISKSTGEKIPLANSAFHDEADLRKVTPEEIAADAAKARQKVKRFEVIRELKNVADNQFDPIEKINKGGFLGFMESMAYGSPQGLAYTATALVPFVGPYLAGAAMFSDEYDQLRSQGMNVDQAIQVGSVSAAIQAGLERTGAKALFGKLPVFEKLMRKIGNPARVGKAGSAGVRFLTAATGEQLVEGAQDLTTPLVQDVAEALGADVPDVKWQPILEKWEGSRLDVLAASLPTIFFGTGVASFADNKRFAQFEERQDIYRMTGMDDAAIKKIEDGKDLAEVQQNFQTEFGKLTPENVKAGVSYIEGKITSAQEQQQDSNTHTLTRETLADGSKKFVIRDPKGEVRYSTEDAQTAQIAISELLRNQITGTTRGIFESMSLFNRMNEATGRGEDIQKFLLSDAPRNLLTDYEANPTEKNLDNLFETVRAFGQDISEPAELANFPVLVSNQGALSEGIFKSVIQIHEGATGDKVVRDVAQDNLKRAIAEQRITMDWVRENLNQVIPLIDSERITGHTLRTETDTDVIESFSDVALAYMTGHIREEQIPAGFRGFLRRMAIVVKDIYRRAYNLKRAIAEGKVDANFETLLADSVGLNQQARVDTARERVASDVLTDTNYSIGTNPFPMEQKGKWWANEDFEQRGGRISTMSPDQFLSQVRPLEVDDASRDNIDDLKNMMQSGRKLDPLAIYADGKEDGRHRAIAAKELGMDTIPVIDFRQPVSTDTNNSGAAKNTPDWHSSPDEFQKHWTDRGVVNSTQIYGGGKYIKPGKIIVGEGSRNSGLGTEFMRDLTAFADSKAMQIRVTPSKDFGATSVDRLKKFYKRFGFVENSGRNKDYEISDTMYRRPSGATNYSIGKKQDADRADVSNFLNQVRTQSRGKKPISIEIGKLDGVVLQNLPDGFQEVSGLPIKIDEDLIRKNDNLSKEKKSLLDLRIQIPSDQDYSSLSDFINSADRVSIGQIRKDGTRTLEFRNSEVPKVAATAVRTKAGYLAVVRFVGEEVALPLTEPNEGRLELTSETASQKQSATLDGKVNYSIGIDRNAISQVSEKDDASRVGTSKLGTAKVPKNTPQESNISGDNVPDELLASQMAKVTYAHLPKAILSETNPQKKRRKLINWFKKNLLALHDAFPEGVRARATHWYDGANRIAKELGNQFQASVEQASGVIAVFSPQKDWFMNVAQAEQFIELWTNSQDVVLEESLVRAEIEGIIEAATAPAKQKRKKQKGETKEQAAERQKFNKALDERAKVDRRKKVEQVIGKTIRQLDAEPDLQGWAIRVLAQITFGRNYRNLSPEGDRLGMAANDDGALSKNGWGSINEIEKAVRIMKDGSLKNISDNLGNEHKVRNFYNNIVAPNTPYGDATIDTHAVAAAHLMPYGAKATEVGHNFGSGMNGSEVLGISGVYHLYLDAYREAAADRGILPRQMQSIVWEAIRLVYPAATKNATTLAKSQKTWKDLTDDSARNTLVGGRIPSPVWAGANDNGESQRNPTGLGENIGQEGVSGGSLLSGVRPTGAGRDGGVNYSIASQSEIDRVNKALGGMNRGPDERLKVYQRAKNSFSRVMQENKEALDAIRSSVSTDTAPATERVEMDRAGKMADVSSEEKTELEKALQDNADTFLPRIEAAQTPAERKKVEREAKDRAKILEQGIRDKFAERKKSVDAEAKSQRDQIVQAAAAKDSASNARMRDKVRHTKLVNAIGELDGILKALPPEVRGRVGGFAVLANIGTGDKALADFFVQRIDMIDRQLERTLKEEYGTQFDALLERTKPKKAKAGEKPKGIGADIQSLFSAVREARGWNPDKVDGHIANLETQIAAGNLTPEEEAWLTREADLVSLAGDWKNADSSRRAAALEAATETWAKGMYEFVQKKMQEREARDIARAEAIKATGKKGDYPDRRARSEADNGLKGKSHGWLMDTMSWDQVAGIVFGHESPIAIELSDGQRKAEYTKIDAVQAKEDAIHDLFTQLAGGSRLEGEKLMWKMSQPSIDAGGLNLSQLEALSPTMLWAQEDGRRHMIGQLDETGNPTSRWHYNQQFIDDIESQLSPEAKAVRDFLWDSYGKGWFSINSVYRDLNGISLPRIFKYSPVTVNPINVPAGMVSDPVTGNAVSAGSISPGALRTRGTAIAQPNFRNVISTYIAHTRQMEHWKAFAPWTKEANGILRNRDVQDSIHEAGGEEANKVLNRFLDAFAQGGNRDASLGLEISQTLSRMTSRAAQVALVGRVGTLAIQFTQIGAASAELPMGAYVSRLGKLMTGNLSWTEALNSPYIQRRIKQMPPSVQIAMEGLKAGKPNQLKHQVTKVGQLISGSDALWTAGTYAMVYDYHLGQAKSFGFAGQAAEEYAHNTAERVTDRLAQPTRMGARSIYEITSTNPGSKLGWAFASEARKNLALLAYTKANRSAGQFGTAALGFVLFNLAMGAFIRNAWKDMKDDDDDELFDEKTWNWKRIGVAMLTEPLQGIPYLGDYIEKGINAALGQYHQSSDLISFERGVRAIKHIPDIIDGERDMEGVLKDIDGMVSLMGMFNQSAAAAASLTHIASDFFGVAKNATTED